jgi:hypothetical protein
VHWFTTSPLDGFGTEPLGGGFVPRSTHASNATNAAR